MRQPKKRAHRKHFHGRLAGQATATQLRYGAVGLRACQVGHLTARQLEAGRRVVRRRRKRAGKVWRCVFPDIPVSRKPLEVRRGKGKGAVAYWVAYVRTGQRLFEVDGVPLPLARSVLAAAASKRPRATEVVVRRRPVEA